MAGVKIVQTGEADSSLVVHAADEAGQARCGTRPRPWHGLVMVYRATDAPVTCARRECAG